jgi:hypothetical protein
MRWELSCEQTIRSRGVCAPALEPRGEWEGSRTKCQDFKPDLGNSAVRHYRGASETVAMAELRTHLPTERVRGDSPPPNANASEFYPNHWQVKNVRQFIANVGCTLEEQFPTFG